MKTTRRILFLLALLTVPSWVSAQINNYVLLDGNDDHIGLPGSLSNYTTNSAGTISMWIRPTGASPTINYAYEGQSLFADQYGYMGISRGIIGGQDRIWLYNYNSGYKEVGISYNAGQWIHIAWVLNGSYLKAYKNGVVVDSVAAGPTDYIFAPVNIGVYSRYFSGFLDEVNTWNRAITPAEVLGIYQTRLGGNEPGLTALWHFDETIGTIAYDSSANGYNATLYNGVAFGPPFSPTDLIAKGGNQQVTLLWNRNTIDNVLRYRVFRDTLPNPVVQIDSTTDTTVTSTGLTNFKKYYFRVATVDVSQEQSGYAEVDETPSTLVEVTTNLPQISQGATAWGDFDSDGDLDVLLVGTLDGYNGEIAKIYKNDGGSNFTDMNAGLQEGLRKASIALGDYDGDTFLDLAYTGAVPGSGGDRIFHLYHNNNGNGTFTEVSTDIFGRAKGSMAFGDYDNDGDLDLIAMGDASSGNRTDLYRNDGNGIFTIIDAGIVNAQLGSVAWGDYDKDSDLDLLITGTTYEGNGGVSGGRFVSIYRNDGGSFVDINGGFPGAFSSTAAWGDYDNDGYLDFSYTGASSEDREFRIYHNNQDGTFLDAGVSGNGYAKGQLSWGDFDNDGDLDILLNGEYGPQTRIYRNNGGGNFEELDAGLEGLGDDYGNPGVVRSAGFADYDKDGDLDILLNGEDNNGNFVTKLYQNAVASANTAPTVPSNLLTTTLLDTVTFSWNKSTDSDQPQNGLTYNLHVGSAAGLENIMPSMAKLNGGGGFRRVVGMGNTGPKNGWKIWDLKDGTYFWGVHAIDNNHKGSNMSTEASFTIDGPPSAPIGLLASSGVSSVNLQWSSTNKSDVSEYYIYASTDNDTYFLADSTVTISKTVTTLDGSTLLQNGTIYYFYITAVDQNGYISPNSDVASAIPSATPGKWFVTNANDNGAGSLRNAIDSTNLSSQSDTIVFSIPGGSVIQLYSSLPAIGTDNTVINGDLDGNGVPDIILSGYDGESSINGTALTINSSNNVIKGLVIRECGNFGTGGAIWISGSNAHDNKILSNYIGTNDSGMFAAANGYGILINDGAHDNWIGDGTLAGRNVISGNEQYGISIDGGNGFCDNNKILGNIIGLSADGLSAIPNASYGIYIYHKARNTRIGNATVGGRNIISGNSSHGIYVEDDGGTVDSSWILGNYIGSDITGNVAVGNASAGIYFYGYSNGQIINSQIGNGTAAGRNIISGNGNCGIYFLNQDVQRNTINGNYIGVTFDGADTLANQSGGIYLLESEDNIILNNVISGNNGTGIVIGADYNSNADDNIIRGNKIGTDATGSIAIGNAGYGIHLQAGYGGYAVNNTIIGGTSAVESNVISGNGSSAIVLGEGGDGYIENTEILRNFIGTSASGTATIPNQGHGIYIYNYNDRYTTIGNGTVAGRNVISGNAQSGIWLEFTSYNTVLGNYVGVDATGNVALPNDSCGIVLWNTSYNRIGDGTAGGRNVVSANGMEGVELYAGLSNNSSYNYIGGNYIGIGANGTTALGNGGHGVEIEARDLYDRTAQDTVYANIIAFNGEDGIHMESNLGGQGYGAYDNPLLGNRIYNNAGEGIALENGANYDVQPPVIDSVKNFTVFGHGIPNAKVEIHKDVVDEGQFIIGEITANGSGSWSITHTAYPGQNITAIQDSVDNTSAFSAPFTVISGNLSPSVASLPFGIVDNGDSVSLPVRIWATGNPVIVTGASIFTTHFAFTGSSLPDTLYGGDTVLFTVKFKPTAIGSLIDTLKLFNSSSVTPVKIALSGTGKLDTPPSLTLGALSVKALNKYMTVYLYSDRVLVAKSVQFTLRDASNNIIDSQSPTLAAVPGQPSLYSTPYKLTAPGTLTVDASGTDADGNAADTSKIYGITSLLKNEAIAFTMDDLEISGVRGSVSQDGYLVISRTDENSAALSKLMRTVQNEHESNVQSETINLNGAWTQIGSSVEILSTTEITKALTISINYSDQALNELKVKYPDFDVRKIGFYREQDGTLVYAGGEGSALSVNSKIDQLGKFTVYYNPTHAFLPKSLELAQNYPNPFNPTTTIKFGLPELGKVKLVVYNILGQRVMDLVNGTRPAGYHTVIWNGRNSTGNQVASGVYIYRLETPKGVQARKMLFIK